MSLPAPTPKCSSTTSVMSPERPERTKRVRPRWAKKVMGKASSASTISGQKPPTPALIGRNRVPAPMAVPYRPSIQVVSCLLQPGGRWWCRGVWLQQGFGQQVSVHRSSLSPRYYFCSGSRSADGQGRLLSIPPSSLPGRPVKSLCICRACRRRYRAWCGSPDPGR